MQNFLGKEERFISMKAKTVNENVNFERGKDPKQAMGVGWNLDRYLEEEALKKDVPERIARNMVSDIRAGMIDLLNKEELTEEIIDLVRQLSPDIQKKWADDWIATVT